MGKLTNTVSGSVASFKSAEKANIESLKAHFLPVQEGTGDPSPSNVRPITGWTYCNFYHTGKNMLPVTTTNLYEWFIPSNVTVTASTAGGNEYGMPQIVFNSKVKEQISYRTLSEEIAGSDRGYRSFPTDKSYYYRLNRSPINSQMEIGSTPTSYEEPNCNIISVGFPSLGKNMFNSTFVNGNVDASSGSISFGSSYTTRLISDYVYLPTGTYTFSVKETKQVTIYFYSIASTNSFVSAEKLSSWENAPRTFTLSNDRYAIFVLRNSDNSAITPADVTEIQVETGSYATSFESCISFYGGYVDPVAGKVVATYGSYTFTGSQTENFTYSNTGSTGGVTRHQFNTTTLDNIIQNSSALYSYSNIATPNHWSLPRTSDCLFYIGTPTNQVALYVIETECDSTVESFKSWLALHPWTIVFPLKNPVEYDITSQQIKALLGQNNIWSNTNSTTEVEYDFTDYLAKKRLALNTPHIETVTNSIASFNTDMKSYLKECKAEFTPVQSGSGNPSPMNIRPITGWTGLNVYNDPAYPGFINWNQIQQDGNMIDSAKWEVGNDYGTISISNNIITWTCTQKPTQFYHTGFRIKNGAGNSNFLSIPYNHKVLVSAFVRCSVSTRVRIYGLVSTTGNTYIYSYSHGNVNINANEWTHICGFISDRPKIPPSSADDVIIKRFKPTLVGTDGDISTINVGTTFDVKCFMAFDLTQMFGAGNEPTVDAFKSLFNLSTYKDYNLGQQTTVSDINSINPNVSSVLFPATKNLLDTTLYGRKDGGSGFSASKGIWSFESVNGGNSCLVWGTQQFNAGTYTFNAKCSGDGIIGFRLLCSSSSCEGTWLDYYNGYYLNSLTGTDKITFTATESFTIGVVFLSNSSHLKESGTLYDIQFELGSTATAYEPFGTVYGGYVDLVRGKLIKTHETIVFNGSENWSIYIHQTYGNSFWIVMSDKKIAESSSICNKYKNVNRSYGSNGSGQYGIFCDHESLNRLYFKPPNNSIITVEQFKTWLSTNNLHVVYELVTPVEYDITPQQLKSLKGQNNIFSNANGNTTVKYWTH